LGNIEVLNLLLPSPSFQCGLFRKKLLLTAESGVEVYMGVHKSRNRHRGHDTPDLEPWVGIAMDDQTCKDGATSIRSIYLGLYADTAATADAFPLTKQEFAQVAQAVKAALHLN
jgi:methionine aminopeptidase